MTHATSLSTLLADWLVLAVVQLDSEGKKGPVIFSNEDPAGNKGLGIEYDRYFDPHYSVIHPTMLPVSRSQVV